MSINATVLLTRPAGRNEALAASLVDRGFSCLSLPALELTSRWGQDHAYLPPYAYDAILFVSGNAAKYYFQCLRQAQDSLPASVYLAGVGPATANSLLALPEVNPDRVLYPSADSLQDSEALWAVFQQYKTNWKRVLIVRGEKGRDWMGAQLEQAGLQVDKIAVYSRSAARWGGAEQQALKQAYKRGPVVCLLSSSESAVAIAANMKLAGLWAQWNHSLFVAIHPRIEDTLNRIRTEAGIAPQAVVKRCTPTDASIIEAIESVLLHD